MWKPLPAEKTRTDTTFARVHLAPVRSAPNRHKTAPLVHIQLIANTTMKKILLLCTCLLIFSACSNEKKKATAEKDTMTCRVEQTHIPPSDVMQLKSYYQSTSFQDKKDTLIMGYNYHTHALDVTDCRTDSVSEIRLDREGDNGVQGRVTGIFIETPDSIWVYTEAMQAYLIDKEGLVLKKTSLHDSLGEGEEVLIDANHAICTARLHVDTARGTLLYGIRDRSTQPASFKVRELDIRQGNIVKDYPLQASVADKDASGYANMNGVNISFHDSLIVYNYPYESHIYLLNRHDGTTRVVEADSRYTANTAKRCTGKDYSEWERHQVENPHFYDVMYLPDVYMYARLHLGGTDYDKSRTLGELLASRPLYVSFFDMEFHKLGEQLLPEQRYSYFTGWCGMSDGIVLFVDNELDKSEFSEDLFFDKIIPVPSDAPFEGFEHKNPNK